MLRFAAEAPARLRSSAVHRGPLSGRTRTRADAVAHGAHVRGAFRRGPLPQCRRPGAIGVLAVWRRRRLSNFTLWLLAPTAERASAQRRAVKRHGRWKGADRRRIPLRLSRAPGRILRHRPTPERRALWVQYGNDPSQRAPPSAGFEGLFVMGSRFARAAVGACRSPAPQVPPLVTQRQIFA